VAFIDRSRHSSRTESGLFSDYLAEPVAASRRETELSATIHPDLGKSPAVLESSDHFFSVIYVLAWSYVLVL
jgi:hypothetical protein